jgi:hypothetical protein
MASSPDKSDDELFVMIRRSFPNITFALRRPGVREKLANYLRGGAGSDGARRRRLAEDLHSLLGDVLAEASAVLLDEGGEG